MEMVYKCPHDSITAEVNSITEVPWFYLERNTCGDVSKEGDIRILVLNDEDRDICMNHEMCHLYEYNTLNIAWEDTKLHKGWD